MRKWHMLAACAALTIGGAICGTINPAPLQALELPAPELTAAFPPDQGEVQAPISEITLIFASPVDLVEVVVVTPDQQRIVLHDASNGGEDMKGDNFTLSLPQPVTMEGTYLIDISASVSDPSDNSASSLSTYSSFNITKGPEAG